VRRFGREIAIAVAAFFVVVSVVSHLAADRLYAPVWPRADEQVDAVARGATLLDPVTGRTLTDVTLQRRRTVALRPRPGEDVSSVLVSTSTTTADGDVVDRRRWTAVHRDRSGRAVASPLSSEKVFRADSAGNQVEVGRALPDLRGQVVRFPRSTPARDLLRWDPETSGSSRARFVGRGTVDGREVLTFRQVTSEREGERRTTARTTLQVRPEIGAVVRTTTDVRTTIGTGATATVVLDATFVDRPDDVEALSGRVDAAVRTHRWLDVTGPALGLLAGAAAAVVALLTGRGDRSARRSTAPTPPPS
jgi:hypothetical protein